MATHFIRPPVILWVQLLATVCGFMLVCNMQICKIGRVRRVAGQVEVRSRSDHTQNLFTCSKFAVCITLHQNTVAGFVHGVELSLTLARVMFVSSRGQEEEEEASSLVSFPCFLPSSSPPFSPSILPSPHFPSIPPPLISFIPLHPPPSSLHHPFYLPPILLLSLSVSSLSPSPPPSLHPFIPPSFRSCLRLFD